jgi:hypothetical protein
MATARILLKVIAAAFLMGVLILLAKTQVDFVYTGF